jgi:hypothetical protein
MTLRVARIRAILGGLFGLLGVAIAVQILLREGPFNQKLMGLGFAVVLIGLGVVRIRLYFVVARQQS